VTDAINVKGLSKMFRVPVERKLTVYDHLANLFKRGASREFWALQDVSFSVKEGETFGVIGANASGKSTLLKLLAGVLYPDRGDVKIRGRIAPFLELGVGFQPELSARDNVYLYGALMGLTRREIQSSYEKIMEFSELSSFENMLLRNFSSGMYVRLAFAVAAEADPEIMLVDEVLSVGDMAFQKKCSRRIDEFRRQGRTILLVSHSLGTVRELCDRCLLLDKGRAVMLGPTKDVLEVYMRRQSQ
jgi:ABC-type polysaccharide/polyol phosphate transport system ATPase subunit